MLFGSFFCTLPDILVHNIVVFMRYVAHFPVSRAFVFEPGPSGHVSWPPLLGRACGAHKPKRGCPVPYRHRHGRALLSFRYSVQIPVTNHRLDVEFSPWKGVELCDPFRILMELVKKRKAFSRHKPWASGQTYSVATQITTCHGPVG